MSSGPQHYTRAEQLLALAGSFPPSVATTETVNQATAHALLALTAAVVDRETGTQAWRHLAAWRTATAGTPDPKETSQ